jgi:hypothetical protein
MKCRRKIQQLLFAPRTPPIAPQCGVCSGNQASYTLTTLACRVHPKRSHTLNGNAALSPYEKGLLRVAYPQIDVLFHSIAHLPHIEAACRLLASQPVSPPKQIRPTPCLMPPTHMQSNTKEPAYGAGFSLTILLILLSYAARSFLKRL